MTATVIYPQVKVKLVGEDGNAFSVIGAVSKALHEAQGSKVAAQFVSDALDSTSYQGLLAMVQRWVTVV